MKKEWMCNYDRHHYALSRFIRIMKLTVFLLLAAFVCVNANVYSQATNLNLKVQNSTVKEVLREIEDQSHFYFMYNDQKIDVRRKVSLNISKMSIEDALDKIFEGTSTKYAIKDRQVVLYTDAERTVSSMQTSKSVSGKVTDSSGAPLPGVTVVIKGTTVGTITDMDGSYSITNVPGEGMLVFSFVGMKSQEIPVAGKSSINLAMEEDAIGIGEVVAVGYGVQRKRDVTGSIQSVDADEIENLPVAQFSQKLQGKAAGVQILQTTGKPGQGMSVRIRGAASINADNQPLYVVDGFPIVGDINSINPDDIESFSILKDASSTSLYGSRAANGVVLIQTKRGKEGKTSISFNAYYGIQVVPEKGRPDIMNGEEFAQFKKEYYEDKIKYEDWVNPLTGQPEVYDEFKNPSNYGKGTDWYDILLRESPVQNYSLSISTSNKKFSNATILSYFNQDGVLLNTGFERFSLRANNEYQVNDHIKFGLNIAPSYTISNNQGTDGGWWSGIVNAATLTTPLISPVNEDGTMPLNVTSPGMFANPNWYRVLKERQNEWKGLRLITNIYAQVELFKDLKYKLRFDVDMQKDDNQGFTPSTASGGLFSAPPQKATGFFNTGEYLSWINEHTFTYNKIINKVHNFDALLGYTIQKYQSQYSSLNGTDFPDDRISWLNAASTTNGASGITEWSMLSYLGRINYNFKNKYLVSMAIRRDGSSRFGKDNRWGTFPSISLGWVVSDEKFMNSVKFLNYLKIRSSYGSTGNNNIGNYTSVAQVYNSNYVFNNILAAGKSQGTLGNSILSWEITNQFDIGLDFGILKDRIYFVYDYYRKKTNNMLYPIEIPISSGFFNVQSNIGEFKFWGHEITISSKNLTNKLKWNTDFNISFNRNMVEQLGKNNIPIGGNSNQGDYNRTEVGQPMGQFYGFVWDGVYMTQDEFDSQPKYATSVLGSVRMKDLNGDKVIDFEDRTFIGNPNPKFIFGLTNSFSYDHFDLNIIIAGSYGNKILDASYEQIENLDGVFNIRKGISDRWRSEENPGSGIYPRTLEGSTELLRFNNTRYVHDGSYAAIKNITLGYTLPSKSNRLIKESRFYMSIQNAYIFTSYPGANPEVSNGGSNGLHQGVDFSSYPVPRTISLGVNLDF